MCHDLEWEMLKQAYAAELARRNREKNESSAKKNPGAAPAKPAERAPGAKDKEPVPA
jgi:hypothetical protein